MSKKNKKKTAKKSAKTAVHKKQKKNPSKRKILKKTVKKSKTGKTSVKKKITVKVAAKKAPSKKAITLHVEHKKVTGKISAIHTKKVSPVTEELSAAENRARAIKKIKGYSKKDLESFKSIILEKRDEIIEQLQNLKEQMLDPTTGEYINENSPYSLHMAEQGTDAMEREKTFLYAQRENKFLSYLEDALKRIEAGTYGICVECIEEPQHLCETCPLIPKERLIAVPHSQHCLPIKQRQEKK
ncbi:MAG TPA: hypothetical protein VI362_04380 [Ignavibacteriaceae bacterium]|nr:hypothetical protein [Ignavibacteriaceae bacterium]